ncbi:hypothetical protein N7507_001019 [Penicillium longicatenatum]|nr:hypothetical protein N7507_001019 [Penicillium longicatenatum]
MSLDPHIGTLSYEDVALEQVQLDKPLFLILTSMFMASLFVGHTDLDKRLKRSTESNQFQFMNIDGNIIPTLIAIEHDMGATTLRSWQNLHGLSMFILHRVGKFALLSSFPVTGTNLKICFLLNVLTDMLLSTLKVANVHFIISQHLRAKEERPTILRCVFSLSSWWRTFPATLLYSVCSSVCFYLPIHAGRLFFLELGEYDTHVSLKGGAVVGLIATLYFAAVVPSYAVFIRVAASALPVQKASREKSESYRGIFEAWRSFPPLARVKFFKSLASVLAMEVTMAFVLSACVLLLFHPLLHEDVILFLVKYAG